MAPRGRRRTTKALPPNYPKHIDPEKLPKGCYWDKSGNGHWYTVRKTAEGKPCRQRLAGPAAKLSELHAIIEADQGIARDTFRYIADLFSQSDQFSQLAKSTRADYEYCHGIVVNLITKSGRKLGEEKLAGWTRPMVQRLVDRLAKERGPSAANHALRYVRRVFTWAANRGHAAGNPAKGIEAAAERKQRRCPSVEAYTAVLQFAQAHGAPYLWIVMELAYLLRMRGIEVITLADAHETPDGILVERRKGSRGNVTEWTPRLRAAWSAAKALRETIRKRRKLPTPMRIEDRLLFLERGGDPLRRSTLDSAWQRMIHAAMTAVDDRPAVIIEADRFSLHDLKRAGITRTKGGRQAKLDGGGHRSPQMLDVYDLEIPRVKPTEE